MKTSAMLATLMAAVTIVGIGLLAERPLVAHHSFTSEFDNSKPVNVKGRVTKMEWVNPHSWVHFDVTGTDGKVVNWVPRRRRRTCCSGMDEERLAEDRRRDSGAGLRRQRRNTEHVGVNGGNGVDRPAHFADDAAGGRQGNTQVSAS